MGQKGNHRSALILFGVVATSIFISEAAIMLFLPAKSAGFSSGTIVMVDSLLLSAIMVPILYFLMYEPITRTLAERNQAEDGHLKARNEWEATFHAIKDPIMLIDNEYRIQRLNSAMAGMLGMTPDEALGMECYKAFHGADLPPEICPKKMLTEGRKSCSVECYEEKLGKHCVFCVYPVYDDEGSLTGAVELAYDITEQKRTQEQLRNAVEETKVSYRVKEEFLANISHELRTPLNGIMGIVELLHESEVNEEQRELLSMVSTSSENLLYIVNDILDFSKISLQKFALRQEWFNIHKVFYDTRQFFTRMAQENGIDLQFEMGTDVPGTVEGDPVRLGQVLIKLISNAIKFTERGEVRVAVRTEDVRDGEAWLRFSVADTGIGIEQDELNRIFESFYQADGTNTRRFGGTGLGLAISSAIVSMMEGTLDVESTPEEGTEFHFNARFALQVCGAEDEEQGADAFGASPDQTADKKLCILLAEDNVVNQKIVVSILRKAGHDIHVAGNGRDALEALNARSFDLVLMDLMMPEMDGYETTRQIRAREKETGTFTPIVALTANAMNGNREKMLQTGMNDCIVKPIRAKDLTELINRVV